MEKRFFISNDNINGDIITLNGEEHNHLANVLRLKVGQEVECFCDGDVLYKCTITQISKNNTVAKINDTYTNPANPKHTVTLFQGLPKMDKLELIVQKCAELGISHIIPFTSQHTIAKANDNKTERLNKISLSASKQCGTTKILKLHNTITFKQMLKDLNSFDTIIFANENEQTTPLASIKGENIAIIVGSEGGFSTEEVSSLINAGAKSITLGKRILRTETAGIVLSSLVMYLSGEMN